MAKKTRCTEGHRVKTLSEENEISRRWESHCLHAVQPQPHPSQAQTISKRTNSHAECETEICVVVHSQADLPC